ncbi:MAG: WecB/TagA/CpsF family glycosyltransferase [Bacilli bacterium]|nr:WecB/TagA/CpsF family glycosyltransferase [Bacilli bacterium]
MKDYFNKVYNKGEKNFYKMLEDNLNNNVKTFVITSNPEKFIMGKKDIDFNKVIMDTNTILTADGVGISVGAKILGYKGIEKITGVDISVKLLEYANKYKKSIYLYGSRQEVIDELIKVINKDYPNIEIKGFKNGYSKDKDKDFMEIIKLEPDIVLVALGMGSQEKLIYKHIDKFKRGIFVGVGGTFDVLSGTKKRAPKLFQKLGLEWLYRIVKEPKRIKRFYDNNVKFMFKLFINKDKWKN